MVELLNTIMEEKMPRGKDGVYRRPKNWEKTIKRSHWDEMKDYSGKKYRDYKKVKEEEEKDEKSKKARKGRFGKLIGKLFKR